MIFSEFIEKWRKVELKERSAAQEHFIDLCNTVDHPTPAAADPTGETFCFEKGAAKQGGGDGFADVWKRGHFGWEYKGKHKDLVAAYDQLLRYRDALENPPLLVVCDLDRIVVHTNFTGTVSTAYDIPLESLAEPRNVEILRAVFHDPGTLRPGRTSVAVTQEAAQHFAEIAATMRQRGLDATAVAHFLDRIVFCLFAEDTDLLPDRVFSRIVEKSRGGPARFGKLLGQLFDTMADGGDFGLEPIRHFNGNLFDDRTVLDLTVDDLKRIAVATKLDWSAVDPSIFGTLFERGLDPAKRAQLGAHFTSRADIELVVDAVVMSDLQREWSECRETVKRLLTAGKKTPGSAYVVNNAGGTPAHPGKILTGTAQRKARGEAESILHRFLDRLRNVRILDPACGSGNFLYVALLRLKDLEKEVAVNFPGENGLNTFLPGVGPWQLHGIEVNSYAHDLAQMTVWIGWLQWIRSNGFGFPADPVLRPLSENIRRMDAILGENGEPDWPAVDFIIGNPPFLGDKLMRRELGDAYVDRLRALYDGRLPGQSDLCCYWFEKARAQIAAGKCRRAGLLATQGIRGGANREVLKRIQETGQIFWAESDRPWVLNGANVHVSMVGFDDGNEKSRTLDGKSVAAIHANLTATANTALAKPISRNAGVAFLGNCKGGPFDISQEEAIELLESAGNPTGKPNSDVVRPVVNTEDLVKKRLMRWIVDSADLSCDAFAFYEKPFGLVEERVKPLRDANRNPWLRQNWWRPQRMRPEMRNAISCLPRFLVTPTTAKHRVFTWLVPPTLPDHQLIVFARSDDLFFGVLQSRFHEVWSLAQGTQLREKESGFRYTPSTCFATFPFPNGVLDASVPTPATHTAIAGAARELNDLRERWLNPPEWTREVVWEFPARIDGPWRSFVTHPDGETGCLVRETEVGWTPRDLFESEQSVRRASETARLAARQAQGIGIARFRRLIPLDAACAAKLSKRTLTALYNERPAWLATCHAKLDAAVAAAYGWPADLTDEAILERLLKLNEKATTDGPVE